MDRWLTSIREKMIKVGELFDGLNAAETEVPIVNNGNINIPKCAAKASDVLGSPRTTTNNSK